MPSVTMTDMRGSRAPHDTWLKRPSLDVRRAARERTNDTSEDGPGVGNTFRAPLDTDAMSVYESCHNTIQGRKLVTDDSGSICARHDVLRNGCCRSTRTIDRLSCGMCRTDVQCCRSYEYCVSCCLSKLPSSDRSADFASLPPGSTTPPRFSFHSFDKCLHLCRTSSRSIRHGNVYRTPVLRHCYTEGEHALPIKFEESATVVVAKQGVSCSRACAAYRGPALVTEESDTPGVVLPPPAAPPLYICHEAFLPHINNCATMKRHFECARDECDMNAGNDQPALVLAPDQSGDEDGKLRGQCLLNGDDKLFDCEGHHEATNRLCVCIQADTVE